MLLLEENSREHLKRRNEKEATIDRLLLLFLIEETNRVRSLWGKTKLEKLVYRAQYWMMKEKIKGFNYFFYRWHHGPFSKEIYHDLDRLAKCGFVTKQQEEELRVTPLGLKVVDLYRDLLRENNVVVGPILNTVSDYRTYSADKIKDEIYETIVYGSKRRRVGETELGEPLLFKLSAQEARTDFRIDSGKLETLEILFTPEFYDQIMKARADRTVLPYSPLT